MGRRRKKKSPMEKIPRTWRHLAEKPADERYIPGPDIPIPSGRIACRRLSWQPHPKREMTSETFARTIAHPNNSEVDWIPDSSMFLAHTDQVVWEALFGTKRVKLVEPVIDETSTWLNDPCPHANKLARDVLIAAKADHSNAPVKSLQVWNDPIATYLVNYYSRLVGVRKRLMDLGRGCLKESLGRDPTNAELANWAKDTYGERSQMIALSGNQPKIPGHRLNDEVLVICAAINAIMRGNETAIITRDEDVYEQFYKTVWMLDTQYRAMLMAEMYAANPLEFPVRRVMDTSQDAFLGEVRLLERPSDTMDEVLPDRFTMVSVHCFLLHEGTTTHLSFSLEREMKYLLKAKFDSKGLNTTLLDGHNCHVHLGPMCHKWGNYAAIGKDRVVQVGDPHPVSLGLTDLNLSLGSFEGFVRVYSSQLLAPGFAP